MHIPPKSVLLVQSIWSVQPSMCPTDVPALVRGGVWLAKVGGKERNAI